jgi:hypothetical protein
MDKETTSLFYNLHLDYRPIEFLAPFVEFNGLGYIAGGDGTRTLKTTLGTLTVAQVQAALGTGGFEGIDVANLGSGSVGGNNIITFAVGTRIPINRHLSLAAAYEFPLTDRRDIFKQRVTMSALLEF